MAPKHWKYPSDSDLVLTALRGLTASNPTIQLIPSEKVVYNPKTLKAKKVAVISGGGAGHEPLHAGYVGENLLDAAVSGAIFASPSTKQIMAAVRATTDKAKGAVIIVKNYTGDILHFGLVAERAKRDGYNVELVVVSDDVAVGKTQNAMVGRRGLAGTALVHKVVGAASAGGGELSDVADLGRHINDALVTISASLDRTSVPGREGEVDFHEDPTTAELGLGIHNEPGEKIKIPPISDLINTLYERLLDPKDKERHYVDFKDEDEFVLLINNIGGTSSLELYAVAHYAVELCPLEKKPTRVYVSDFVTSLNSPGFSITLLNLNKVSTPQYTKDDVIQFLDTETSAPGWKPKVFSSESWSNPYSDNDTIAEHVLVPKSAIKVDSAVFERALRKAMQLVIEKEPLITKFDTQVGDGDCGETLKNGAESILKNLSDGSELKTHLADPVAALSIITELVEDSMGGTSGGIYAIYLTSLVKNLQEVKDTSISLVARAMKEALYEGLFKYTKARKGGRTLVDTLQPFVDTLVETGDLQELTRRAKESCEATAKLHAKFGRASYVNESEFHEEDGGVPDPGAVGLLAIIEGFTSEY